MQNEQSVLRTDDMLSQADIILPSQYFGTIGRVGLSGEQRLMLAVLADAINVLLSWKGSGSARKRHNFAEAAKWVNRCGITHHFSFDSVCDALEIESEVLRARLRSLTTPPANSLQRPCLPRLRLKESSRSQRMTVKQPRRRRRVQHTVSKMTELPLKVHEKQARDFTSETSVGLVTFDESSTDVTAAQRVSE